MQYYIIYTLLFYLRLPLYNCVSFKLYGDTNLRSYSHTERVGEVTIHTYRPKTLVKSISFSADHHLDFEKSDLLIRLKTIIKNNEIKLVHITYADLSNENELDDLYYHKLNGEFSQISKDLFYMNFVKLSNNNKVFDIKSLKGDWFTCYEGLTEKKLCSVDDYYFVYKIVIGDRKLWENNSYYNVHSIELGYNETEENTTVRLKIYCHTKNGSEIIPVELPISPEEANCIKEGIDTRRSRQTLVVDQSPRNLTVVDKSHPTESREVKPVENPADNLTVVHTIDKERLKDIELYFENDTDNKSKKYKVRHTILLGLDNTYYEPTPGNEIKCIKDGEVIIWYPSEMFKNLIHARFTYLGDSPILLNVKYNIEKKQCLGRTKIVEKDEFFIKKSDWYTTSEEKFSDLVRILMNNQTKKVLDSGVHVKYALPPEQPEALQSQENEDYKNRLKHVKLEINPPDPNGYNVSTYLMDGLDTYFFDPKEGKTVESVMERSVIIWSSDDQQRKLKHAKFAYKNDSHIFLSVLFSEVGSKPANGGREPVKTDYFIKRDQWYHSPEEDFFEQLDKLKNKVTMKNVILNEKKSFMEHVSDLNFTIPPRDRTFTEKILRKKLEPLKLTPFEYNIQSNEHEHLLVDVNMKDKFSIYTPKDGYALTRLFDNERLIWYQETDGFGCTTFYMDLSGKYPLLHLLLDDPLNSHIYYKKMDNNWHIIEKAEYEQIRAPPSGQPNPNDFHRIA